MLDAGGARFLRTARGRKARQRTLVRSAQWQALGQIRTTAPSHRRPVRQPGSILRSTSTACATPMPAGSTMRGVPLVVIAAQLGHSDTRMVEKHYGHMAPAMSPRRCGQHSVTLVWSKHQISRYCAEPRDAARPAFPVATEPRPYGVGYGVLCNAARRGGAGSSSRTTKAPSAISGNRWRHQRGRNLPRARRSGNRLRPGRSRRRVARRA